MRGFMQLYQGFIAPLASRYFTEDYELDQQHNLKKFKERDDHIIEALNTHRERKHPANTALPSDPISLNLVPT